MKRFAILIGLIMAFGPAVAPPAVAQDNKQPVVRGVLFWLDTCPHCHYVIEEVLPPLQEQYGDQLDLQLIEVDSQEKAEVFYAAGEVVGLTRDTIGVPLLVVGDNVMVGSVEIPEKLPGLIEAGLADGGVDWPDLPGMAVLVPMDQPFTAAESPLAPVTEDSAETAAAEGISGSIPAFLVMAGMVLALGFVVLMPFLVRRGSLPPPDWAWIAALIPVLAAAGIVVAGYLAYVETQAVAAVCGPVGNCNAVQTSAYARFLGIPVGVIGIAGYLAILGAWFWGRNGNVTARTALLAMAAFGVMASIYLTWLELFVIRAVCMWCVSSAVIMTLLMLAAAAWLAQAWVDDEPELEAQTVRT